jgi:protein-tyrosine sulfotransferase
MVGSSLVRLRNRGRRLRQRGWRMADYRSEERHIVMGGAPRSGTTLLRRILDRHPDVRSGAETKLFVPAAFNLEWLAQAYLIPLADLEALLAASRSQGSFVDAFADRVKRDAGKSRWAEKTPMNIRNLDWIMPRWPEATIVHIIRDGRDVICSMRTHPDWHWSGGTWQKKLVPRSIGTYARRWLADTATGTAWRGDSRYVEIRYEDLVADPPGVLRSLCDGVGISADRAWLDAASARSNSAEGDRPDYDGAVSAASVGRWREDLTPAEQTEVSRLCGSRLRALGYI